MKQLRNIPRLGVGLGFRSELKASIFMNSNQIDFLEIIADHFLDPTYLKEEELELLNQEFVLIPHGLNLSLGSAEGIDSLYLEKLAKLIEKIQPPYWSEHIAFTQASGIQIGHLAPLPFHRETIRILCKNIEEVQKRISVPLILENITYTLDLPYHEMSEAQFLTEVLERTHCGLLLDVTNLYTNSVNHQYDPIAFLEQLPLDHIVQLHFSGGNWRNGILVDSHSDPTPEAIWNLMKEVCSRVPVKGIILERDENIPLFQELLQEINRARIILESE